MRFIKILFLSIIAFSCSNGEEISKQMGELNILKGYERLLYSRPDDVLDSLNYIESEFREKSEYSAYSALLYSIAFEQKYGTLRIDSLINKSAQWYGSGEDYYNRCRSMLYKSIALYSLNRVDSNAYLTIKEAESLYKKIEIEDSHIGATLYLYLGRMNRTRSQAGVAEEYLKKSLEMSKLANNRTGVLNSSLELFTFYLSYKRYSEALSSIACFGDEEQLPPYIEYNLYNSLFNYYVAKKDIKIAIEYLKKILSITNTEELDINYPKIYYQLALQYKRMEQQDSTLHYGVLSVNSIKDSNSTDSHFYFRYLGDIYASMGELKTSNSYYKKAYHSYINAYTKLSRNRVLEIERKYDVDQKNYQIASLGKERIIFVNFIFLLTAALVITISIYAIKKRRMQKKISQSESDTKRFEENLNKLWITSEICKSTSFIFPQLIDNVYMEAVRSRKLSNEVFDSLNSIIDQANSLSRSSLASITTTEEFYTIYGTIENLDLLTDFEKLIYVLNEEGFSNQEIANFLNSSEASIRTMKSKIIKKIQKS
jgi:tetratricopeptide (TPR) repeat protein